MTNKVIKIEGGHKLEGTVRISGSKNAIVALIPAAVLASDKEVILYDVPSISDVKSLSLLLEDLNVKVNSSEEGKIIIDATNLINTPLISEEVTKLRASYYFMGALLGKCKRVQIKMPGGCYLGPRPIDQHLKGFEALGAKIDYIKGDYHIVADKLIGTDIFLDVVSVGATINIMMAAVFAEGRTVISNAAKEPEIIDIATLLNKMGANIKGAGTSELTIEGVEKLTGCSHEIIPDRIEAGTFVIIASAIAKRVVIENIIPHHLESLLSKLKEMNVQMDIDIDKITIYESNKLNGVDINTAPFPGFATDLQQPLVTLLTQAEGVSMVKETIYAERFKNCLELQRMGAEIELSPATAIIKGKKKLYGDSVVATDLRCGAGLIVAGLIAEGITEIHDIHHIDRGYEGIDCKLSSLGAKIWREKGE